MQNRRRKNANAVASVLAAAGFAAWIGAPAARGDFTVTAYDLSDDYGVGTSVVGTTQPYTTWVFAAQTSGSTGTAIEAAQVILDAGTANPGAFGVDVESNGRTGATARYTANLDGSLTPANGIAESQNNTEQSVYGDPEAGTFGGLGFNYNIGEGLAAPFVPGDISDNPFITPGAGNLFKVYTNLQTQSYRIANNISANYETETLANLNAAFENGGTVNIGQIDNGSLFSLQEVMIDIKAGYAIPQSTVDGPIPFMQVVVQTGVAFTFSALFSGSGPAGVQTFSTVISGASPIPLNVGAAPLAVVPEPTGIGAMVLGGFGLLKRRRRVREASERAGSR